MTAREIAGLFEELELQLIASLKRNLARHKAREAAEGGQNGVPERWEAWQAAKLRDLRRFRRENQAILTEKAPIIETESRRMILEQAREGGSNGFFGMNDRRVNALLEEMQSAQERVEKAALRYMDDVYRRTVRSAALGMATGSMTLQQATDAATRDFLAAGINCIEYRDGRRVNIATYAEMALRTAGTRALLLGEARQREALGIDTVLVSQYGGCSDTCLPWQGLVYIDDVWQEYKGAGANQGGTYGYSRNGRSYPMLSVAVKAGLFHPNCRHILTTWVEGVSERPKPMDKAKIEAASRLEAKQRELERKVRRAKREEAGLQEPEAVKAAKGRVRTAQKELREFVAQHGDVLRRDPWRERMTSVVMDKGRSAGGLDGAETQPQMIGKMPDATPQEIKDFLQIVEGKSLKLPFEVDYTVLPNGEVWFTRGDRGGVHPEMIQSLHGRSLEGSYSFHNHPAETTNYSLSAEDVGFFFEHGVQYSQAGDRTYTYFMERTAETPRLTYDAVYHEFLEYYKTAVAEKAYSGELDYEMDGYHETMIYLSQKYKFIYRRRPQDGR